MPSRPFPEPPIPVSATWEDGSQLIQVTFDQPIADGALDAANWSFLPVALVNVDSVIVSAGVVRVVLTGVPDSVTDVSFNPPPFDVVADGTGEPAEGFSNYPVVTS